VIYLSQLVLNRQSRQVQGELRDPYQMHRTLSKAFGDGEGTLFSPRPLFRIVEGRNSSLRLLVQSRSRPDWDRLTVSGSYLAEPPAPAKELNLHFCVRQRLRFRLRANPTVRRVFGGPAPEGEPKKSGMRVGVYGEENQREWLARKADQGGFRVVDCRVADRGLQVSRRRNGAPPLRHLCVDYEGILEVTDPETFLFVLESGIGSAKAFGFGLLSVARA